MEIAILAPVAGRIGDVLVARNVQVDAGTPLFRIESAGDREAAMTASDRIDLAALASGGRPDHGLELARASLLGFDVEASAALRSLEDADRPDEDTDALAILDAFADLCALAPERRDPDADTNETRGSREYLNAYLRSLDVEREGLPEWFSDRLRRGLAHYGLSDLDPSPALEEALLRIFVSQQRREEQLPLVVALLEGPLASAGLRETLDHVIEATRRRHPALASLARGVRYSRFDRPLIDRSRAEVSATMKQLAAGVLDATERAVRADGPPRGERTPAQPDPRPGEPPGRQRLAGTAARRPDPPLLQDPRPGVGAGRAGGGARRVPGGVRPRRPPRARRGGPGGRGPARRGARRRRRGRRRGRGARHGHRRRPPAADPAEHPGHADPRAERSPPPRRRGDAHLDPPGRGDPVRRLRRPPHVPTRQRRRRPALLDGLGARPGDLRRGHQVPRVAPDDRPPPADVAPEELRDPAAPRAGRASTSSTASPGTPRPTSGSSPSPRSGT